jgi:RNA polymerase sigma-70 factor (ECF subfamily)
MSEDHDRELVKATLAGDSEAFERLVTKHERALFNAAYRITGNREDAMDATQTALVKAYDRLGTFNPAYRFFSWIFRIVVNESLNIVNRRNRYTEHDPDLEISSKERNPEEAMALSQLGRQVHRAVQELTGDLRAVLVLRHFHGMTYREMGEVIGIPEKTVKSRLFSARRRLREVLLEWGLLP